MSKRSSIKVPEVININFPQIWYFEVKGTGWVGLELSVILAQLWEVWICELPLTQVLVYIGKGEVFHMLRPEYLEVIKLHCC